MMRTLVIGLGRSGSGLHLPVLARARAAAPWRHLFADAPPLTFDPFARQASPPGTIPLGSLAEARTLADPARTVVHLCTPPTVRVGVLGEIARMGFRMILVEKPLAVDTRDLVEITRLCRRWGLAVLVVAPWRSSELTRRIEEILGRGEMGALAAISVVQRKARFTRSQAGDGHHSVFDVETPHAVGLALALAGPARLHDAAWTEMRMGDTVLAGMGTGWLSLDHASGVRTEVMSDLTSPIRERRITLEMERGRLVGHYPTSEHDHTAQLQVTGPGREDRLVFHDDALTAFMVHAYQRFAAPSAGTPVPLLDAEVVQVLDEAKRRCQGRAPLPLQARSSHVARRPPAADLAMSAAAAAHPPPASRHAGTVPASTLNGHHRPSVTVPLPAPSEGPDRRRSRQPTIRWAGIGDEAGFSLADQVGALNELGWTSIELRTVDGLAVADLDDQAFGRLTEDLGAQGFEVACVASSIANWSRPISGDFFDDLRELEVLGRRCPALGTRYVRVMSYPNAGLSEHEWGRQVVERMRRLAGRAEDAGLVLVHENCSGWAGTRAERMLALLDRVNSPALRLLFDTGNGIAHGYDAYEMLTHIVEHVTHVHVKDATGDAPEPVYTVAGLGRARVADCLRLLVDKGYTGSWSIEPHIAVQPHASVPGHLPARNAPALRQRRRDSFVDSGRALEQLVRHQVLSAAPGWTSIPGGIVARQGS